jgi:hypothetical protein
MDLNAKAIHHGLASKLYNVTVLWAILVLRLAQ